MNEYRLKYPSPIGTLTLVASDAALIALKLADDGLPERANAIVKDARAQLDAWFSGRRRRFELPLAPRGTAFQRRVWQALAEIEYGATTSYAELARRLDKPNAVRAVGAANGKNPLPIVLPCHRVIGSGGALVGYAGGLPAKAWLLAHEARWSASLKTAPRSGSAAPAPAPVLAR